MATKDVILKKRLIKEGIIAGVILCALGGAAFLASNFDGDAQAAKNAKQAENNSISSDYSSIKQLIGTQFELSEAYETYIKNHNNDFLLNREAVTNMLSNLREKNHLINLEVSIAPVSDMSGETFALKTGIMTKSDISLSFSAMSDNSAYNFIEELERELPGIVFVRDLKITRVAELSRNILLDLSQQHKITPMVTGEVSFLWLGIRPKPEEKPANGAGNAK
jgi:hypothetical protein